MPLKEKGVSKQLLLKVLPTGQIKEPGSTKLLFTELAPFEPPTCPPFQLAVREGACCCGAGRSTTRSLFGLAGISAALAGCRMATADSKPTPATSSLMTRPRWFSISPLSTLSEYSPESISEIIGRLSFGHVWPECHTISR
ncbi:MAG TPA: hypothetical protein VI009_04250 [Xanthobacteraceae bacterium]